MDWKYIFSLMPDVLSNEEKDNLYDQISWFNIEAEDLNTKKYKALMLLSQTVLRYKGEQVETLLHELDELAMQQGEQDVRKIDSDTEVKSIKSRISSSIEYENLEQKLFDIKNKYKKQLKINEKYRIDLEKMQNRIIKIEQENKKLQHEFQLKSHEESESDISETVRDQQKELIDVIQNKNKQISDLLHDIELVEKDNFMLRDKLTNAKDELSTATEEINLLTEKLTSTDVKLAESVEKIQQLTGENEVLQEQLQDITNEKQNLEYQMEEFTNEINLRINDWKKLLAEKDAEIYLLKAKNSQSSVHSSLSSLPNDENEVSQLVVLNKLLMERENKLVEVQTQLKDATSEMVESTQIIENLKSQKDTLIKKLNNFTTIIKDLRKQLKSAHERSQMLQEETSTFEKEINLKNTEVKELINELKENGQIDISKKIEELHKLKSKCLRHEKQIHNLVKATNILQENYDQIEKENFIFRDKLGIPEDEIVNISDTSGKKRKHLQEMEALKNQILKHEENNINLNSKIHNLNRSISVLSNQLIDMGQRPEIKSARQKDEDLQKESTMLTKDEIESIINENEALRKGLHEILNSINTKKETTVKEIKSETLEQLLRALDVKHISGWYHPAMRLQAELHNTEGINAELREQLRLLRIENEKYKQEDKVDLEISEASEGEVFKQLHSSPIKTDVTEEKVQTNILEDVNITESDKCEIIFSKIKEILSMLANESTSTETIQSSVGLMQYQIKALQEKYENDINDIEQKLNSNIQEHDKLKEGFEIASAQVKVLTENQDGDSIIKKLEEYIKNNILHTRKITYLENELNKVNNEKCSVGIKSKTNEQNLVNNIRLLNDKNIILSKNIKILENNCEIFSEYNLFKEIKTNLFDLTLKYRELLKDYQKLNEDESFKMKLLEEGNKLLQQEKLELKDKLKDVLGNIHAVKFSNQNINENVEKLSKKIAECEINEISERQRADHTNNLYELVKEQLDKSEEKFKEYSKYNESILHKNLVLQEQLKDAENKLCDNIDNDLYKEIQSSNNELLKEVHSLLEKVNTYEEEIKMNENVDSEKIWSNTKEQELLSLKHEIVDLVAISDEKMQIAQLHSDIRYYKTIEADCKYKIDNLTAEISDYKNKINSLTKELEKSENHNKEKQSHTEKKLSLLQELLMKQKMQYLGCIPIISEEKFVNNIRSINEQKKEIFLKFINIQKHENQLETIKEQCNYELQNLIQQQKSLVNDKDEHNKLLNWLQEKKNLQLSELKYKRQAEFKDVQLKHLMERIGNQDQEISQLEEEMLLSYKNKLFENNSDLSPKKIVENDNIPAIPFKITKTEETQTVEIVPDLNESDESKIVNLKAELINVKNELSHKEQLVEQLKTKITELEMTISVFRKQIGDKQSQITFYERHILEIQNKKEELYDGAGGDNITVGLSPIVLDNEENTVLKTTIKKMQETMISKEKAILDYESLLKEDRDKHSLAAERLQEEIKVLQKHLNEEKEKSSELEENLKNSRPSRAAIEEYIKQVHALEKHTSELHTSISSLDSQLQASRQEAVRWRTLANERLEAMNELHKNLEDQHTSELAVYKEDSRKWREEVNNLKDLIAKHRSEVGNTNGDVQKTIKEKENKIHELTVMLRQSRNDLSKIDKSLDKNSPKLIELESSNEQLQKENESLRKRYEQVVQRERYTKDENRELKSQLLKKPMSYIKADKTEKSIKDQLQKKITVLENEILELKENLTEQITINQSHKVKISEDFERWKKQKHWQQTIEKLKTKLKDRDMELEKLTQTSSSYRALIERLEREKHNLENRIKNLKSVHSSVPIDCKIEMLRNENIKLLTENQSLSSKLEMSQHHAGGLGAALLQEKLEAQERKIAVLELSAKGTVEVRAELDRLQTTISNLQKTNLCLEAENLEYKLDLEKSRKEVPQLQEQIQHLESYLDVLKNENLKQITGIPVEKTGDDKKVSELERTVFVLKRVVEKLQVENKRLLNGKKPFRDRISSADKLKRDNQKLKEQYAESIRKVAQLEQQLVAVCKEKTKDMSTRPLTDNVKALSDELARVSNQLEQKTHLLDKVKVLLHRAAVKEKSLLQEIAELKHENNPDIETF